MRLYFAGGLGNQVYGEQHIGALVRNRMCSFADAGAGEKQSRVFWVECRSRALKLYVAGNVASNATKSPDLVDYETGVRNRLLSYAFESDWAREAFEFWVNSQPQGVNVIMDSGAFSVWRRGETVSLDAYCEYLFAHREALAGYIVLDVIGSVEGTAANLREMRRRGLDPMPVYHSDREPLSVWQEILAENTGYVCLGGLALERPNPTLLRARIRECWRALRPHWPVKVHGLGVMTQWMVEEFPFYSVDSASAIMGAGMGGVYRFDGGRFKARGWREDVRLTYDGTVADGVGRVATADSKSISAHAGRRLRNIQAQLALERYVTDLWAHRGISWDAAGNYTGAA